MKFTTFGDSSPHHQMLGLPANLAKVEVDKMEKLPQFPLLNGHKCKLHGVWSHPYRRFAQNLAFPSPFSLFLSLFRTRTKSIKTYHTPRNWLPIACDVACNYTVSPGANKKATDCYVWVDGWKKRRGQNLKKHNFPDKYHTRPAEHKTVVREMC